LLLLQARQVLRWKNDKPVLAEKVWDTLAGANTEIFDTLEEMNNQYRVSGAVCCCAVRAVCAVCALCGGSVMAGFRSRAVPARINLSDLTYASSLRSRVVFVLRRCAVISRLVPDTCCVYWGVP
jgi:hypothetical protein